MTCVFFTLLFVTNALISAPEPQAPAGDFNARIEYTLKNPARMTQFWADQGIRFSSVHGFPRD